MKDILNAPFVVETVRMCSNMYAHGWDERNSGNISLLLREEELADYVDVSRVLRTLPAGFAAPELAENFSL